MDRDHFWLEEGQFARVTPHLPTDTRGKPRADDRRVISGIVHVLKSGCRWADAPEVYAPRKTLYNRFVQWAAKGVWLNIFHALAATGGPPAEVLIDSSVVKAHRCGFGGKGGTQSGDRPLARRMHDKDPCIDRRLLSPDRHPADRRPGGRPLRFTPELAAKICGLIATGSTLRAAAKACGVGWRTVARWNVERPEFREAYEQARETRTLTWAEECIDIVDRAQGDYVKNPKTGKLEFNRENVHRAKLRVDERHWQMARLDRRLWGDRQEIDVKHDWSHLTEAERVRKAMAMLDMAEEIVARGPVLNLKPSPLVYDPTDGDELAEAERRKRLKERQEAEDDDAPIAAGGIGR